MNDSPITPSLPQVPELSVVILCYHAGGLAREIVVQTRKVLEGEGIDYELVLVGNYLRGDSGDPTPAVLREIAEGHPRIRVVAREKNGMMGWDMRSGLAAATGRNIVVIDGDGQMPMSDVLKVYRVLQIGGYDLVKTFRAQRGDGPWRHFVSSGYNFLFRLLYPRARIFRDINSKPKIMTRAAYEKMSLESDDWFIDAEIMIEALKHNLEVGEVSTVFYANQHRASFVAFGTIFEFLRNFLRYRFLGKTDK